MFDDVKDHATRKALKELNERLGEVETWKREQISAEDRTRSETKHAVTDMLAGAKNVLEQIVTTQVNRLSTALDKIDQLFLFNKEAIDLVKEARDERIRRETMTLAEKEALKKVNETEERIRKAVEARKPDESSLVAFKTEKWKAWTVITVAALGIIGAIIKTLLSQL